MVAERTVAPEEMTDSAPREVGRLGVQPKMTALSRTAAFAPILMGDLSAERGGGGGVSERSEPECEAQGSEAQGSGRSPVAWLREAGSPVAWLHEALTSHFVRSVAAAWLQLLGRKASRLARASFPNR